VWRWTALRTPFYEAVSSQVRLRIFSLDYGLRGDAKRVKKIIDMQNVWLIQSIYTIMKSVRLVGKALWTKNIVSFPFKNLISKYFFTSLHFTSLHFTSLHFTSLPLAGNSNT
jgi:hypothetical protein